MKFVEFSPCGNYIILFAKTKVKLFPVSGSSSNDLATWNCAPESSLLEWSPDSTLILLQGREDAQILNVNNNTWRCSLKPGTLGAKFYRWSPDSRNVLALAKNNVCIIAWSLVDKSLQKFGSPKPRRCQLQFSEKGSWLAVTEVTKQGKDIIKVYASNSWIPVQEIDCEMADLMGFSWLDEGSLAFWDGTISNKLCFALVCGTRLAAFEGAGFAFDSSRAVETSSTKEYIAVCSRRKVQLISVHTLRIHGCVMLPQQIDTLDVVVFKEVQNPDLTSHYEVVHPRPFFPPSATSETRQMAIRHISFSYDDTFLATVYDTCPSTVWIWDVKKLVLFCVLVHINSVVDLKWSPRNDQLAIATGTDLVFVWSPRGSSSNPVGGRTNPSFPVSRMQWNSSGQSLLACSKDSYEIIFVEISVDKNGLFSSQ